MKVRMILPVVLAVLASCTDLDPLKTEILLDLGRKMDS